MLRYSTILLFLIFLASQNIFAQDPVITKSEKTEIISGKKYYIHKIEKGQTLFSLSRAYNVLISDIVFENPDALNGLKKGEELKIPFQGSVKDTTDNSTAKFDVKYITVTAAKGQTLYSISREYDVTVDEIIAANPELSQGLKKGQTIKIPFKKKKKEEIVVPPPAPVVIKPPIDTTKKSEYNVALFLPFHLDDNEKIEFNQTENETERLPDDAINGLQFYEGFLLAIDTLRKRGVSLKVNVFDSGSDSTTMKKLLEKPGLEKTDLIIGPFSKDGFEQVAAFAKKHEIPAVSPLLQSEKILTGNPFVSKVVPTTTAQVEHTAAYIATKYSTQNIVLLETGANNEKELMSSFLKGIKETKPGLENQVKQYNYKDKGSKGIDSVMSLTLNNIMVVFSGNQTFVSTFFIKMNNKRDDYTITLLGMPSWRYFENLDLESMLALQQHVFTSSYIDYDNWRVKSFISLFRDKYKGEPEVFAFQGYDVGFYYLLALHDYGKSFYKKLPIRKYSGLQTVFDFSEPVQEDGYENKHCFVLKYEDYKLIRVNK